MFLCVLKRVVKPMLLASLFASTPSLSAVYIQVVDAVGYENLKRMRQLGLDQGNFLNSENQTVRELTVNGTGNTGPSHATAFTGLTPEQGGWIGNTYIAQGEQFNQITSAFGDVHPQRHDNLVNALHRKGQSVACLNVPTINMNSQCELQQAFRRRSTESCGLDLAANHVQEDLRACFSTQDDQVKFSDNQLHFLGQSYSLPVEQVTRLCWEDDGMVHSRLLWREKLEGKDHLYVAPTHAINVNEEFKKVAGDFLCWPGVVDPKGMRNGRVSPKGFYAITQAQNTYAFELARHVLSLNQYDVVIGYTSFIDTLQHEFATPDSDLTPAQTEFRTLLIEGYQALSTELSATSKLLDENDSMLVFSDHGTVYAHSTVFPNGLLRSIGVQVEGDKPEAKAITSGALVHVYFSDSVTNQRKADIAKQLQQLKIDGKSVFSKVYSGKSKPSSMLNHPNSGDIVSVANAGFSLDPRIPPTSLYAYPTAAKPKQLLKLGLSNIESEFLLQGTPNRVSPGVHGFQADLPEVNGIVSAKGPILSSLKKIEQPEVKDMKALVLSLFDTH